MKNEKNELNITININGTDYSLSTVSHFGYTSYESVMAYSEFVAKQLAEDLLKRGLIVRQSEQDGYTTTKDGRTVRSEA